MYVAIVAITYILQIGVVRTEILSASGITIVTTILSHLLLWRGAPLLGIFYFLFFTGEEKGAGRGERECDVTGLI